MLLGWAVTMSVVWNLFVPRGLSVGGFGLLCLAGPALVVAGTMFLIAQAPSQSVRQIRARLDSEERARADARSSR
jgi:hypothetical protein